jgi:hypothetical protein
MADDRMRKPSDDCAVIIECVVRRVKRCLTAGIAVHAVEYIAYMSMDRLTGVLERPSNVIEWRFELTSA